MTLTLSEDFQRLQNEYATLLAEHGDSAESVKQVAATQDRRMSVLTAVGDPRQAKILDWGCGTGRLLEYLREYGGFNGQYVGIDISQPMIETARAKFPESTFHVRDVLETGLDEEFDFIFVNGVFNDKISDNWAWIEKTLRLLYGKTRIAMSFNLLSTYVDFKNPAVSYISPDKAFRFCKEELSPCVTLRHDYQTRDNIVPFEYTVYVYRSDQHPRTELRDV